MTRIATDTTRRYQTSRAIKRRVARAYGAMGRLADRKEGRWPGMWVNMLAGPAYHRWARARAHELVCKHAAEAC